jgi:hypothetical protein
MEVLKANIKSLADPFKWTSHGQWAQGAQALSRANSEIVIEVDVPEGTHLSIKADLHLPEDHDFGMDENEYEGTHDFDVTRIYDLPTHTPESRGFHPGPHGYTYPEVDVTVESPDGAQHAVKVSALLHPHAYQEASGNTGETIHVALGETRGEENTEEHMLMLDKEYAAQKALEAEGAAAVDEATNILSFPPNESKEEDPPAAPQS